jgi:hypothetical protein
MRIGLKSADKKYILQLARDMETVEGRWEPLGYEEYERAVEEFVRNAQKPEVVELIVALEEASLKGEATGPFALNPALRAFGGRWKATPELLVETYRTLQGTGGKALEIAPEYLRKAYRIDPRNRLVLWEMFKSHGFIRGIPRPSFPDDLKLSAPDLEHEKECLRRIIAAHPTDNLAQRVLDWVEKHNVSYHQSRNVPVPMWEIDKQTRPTAIRSLRHLLQETDP